jgi:hypothetical protein
MKQWLLGWGGGREQEDEGYKAVDKLEEQAWRADVQHKG